MRMIALIMICSTLACVAGAQSYTVSSNSILGGYQTMAGAQDVYLPAGTLSSEISPTGFSFNYFGTAYTSFKIGASGYIVMGGAGATTSSTPAHGTDPGLAIAPLWASLNPGYPLWDPTGTAATPTGGVVQYLYQTGLLYVEWYNVPHTSASTRGVCMMIVLNTTNGEIDFRYGATPTGTAGVTTTGVDWSAAISGPSGTGQEVIAAFMSGAITTTGQVTTYPAGRYVRFTPAGGGGNTPPTIAVTRNGGTAVADGSVINVNFGDTLASLGLQITVDDADNNDTKISTSFSDIGATGVDLTNEWEQGASPVSYQLNPTTGTFNTAAGVTHTVVLTANDAIDHTDFTFYIVQAPQGGTPAPSMSVSDGAAVAHGQAATGTNRDFGSLDLAAAPSTPLTITVNNTGNANLTLSGFNVTGDSGHFLLNTSGVSAPITPGNSGTFTIAFDPQSIGQKVAVVNFNHNDTTQTNPFNFQVIGIGTQAASSAPILIVRENDHNGAPILNGAAATGNRDFGSLDITATPSSPITIHVQNVGNADLSVGEPASGNADFTVIAPGLPTTLTPGASITFQIRFTPGSAGVKTASIVFAHDDTSTATPFSFGVQGTATTSTPAPPPGGGGGFGGGGFGGGGGGGGGGCAAVGESTTIWLLALAAVAVFGVRTRRRASS